MECLTYKFTAGKYKTAKFRNHGNKFTFQTSKREFRDKATGRFGILKRVNPIYGFSPEKSRFSNFIERRKFYLDSLNELEDDWISGYSERPSENTIKLSKRILDEVKQYIELNNITPPKILLGPKPLGGIMIEISFDNENSINIGFNNDSTNEVEVELDGYFLSQNIIDTAENYILSDQLEKMI